MRKRYYNALLDHEERGRVSRWARAGVKSHVFAPKSLGQVYRSRFCYIFQSALQSGRLAASWRIAYEAPHTACGSSGPGGGGLNEPCARLPVSLLTLGEGPQRGRRSAGEALKEIGLSIQTQSDL